ncbi:hypothetical protein T484DRAFT_1906401 [Baffinella frigidus]|nr:hypothetical protein T484DRAFT_1906401 [Cryptophyta sp. CCMP2293]
MAATPPSRLYTTPAELAAMEVNDPSRRLRLINETLIHLRNGGDPSEAPLVLPRFKFSPTCPQLVPGYGDDGAFDPEALGATWLVDKNGTAGVIKPTNSKGTWILNPGGGKRETDQPGLVQTHCTCEPRKGHSKEDLDFTLNKFELTDPFQDKTTPSGLYLVSTMQRTWSRPPKADAEEQGGAATCYTPPGTIKADVYTKPTGAAPSSAEDANMSRLLRETSPGPSSDSSSWVDDEDSSDEMLPVPLDHAGQLEEVRGEMLAGFARLGGAVAALGGALADQQGAAAALARLEAAEAAHSVAMGCKQRRLDEVLSEAGGLREQVVEATNEAAALRAEMAEQEARQCAEAAELRAALQEAETRAAELAGALAAANASRATEHATSAAALHAAEGLRAACEGELGAARRDMAAQAASLATAVGELTRELEELRAEAAGRGEEAQRLRALLAEADAAARQSAAEAEHTASQLEQERAQLGEARRLAEQAGAEGACLVASLTAELEASRGDAARLRSAEARLLQEQAQRETAAEEEESARAEAAALQAKASAQAAEVGRKALFAAVGKGQDEVVQALLDVGVANDALDMGEISMGSDGV